MLMIMMPSDLSCIIHFLPPNESMLMIRKHSLYLDRISSRLHHFCMLLSATSKFKLASLVFKHLSQDLNSVAHLVPHTSISVGDTTTDPISEEAFESAISKIQQ